MFTGLIEELGTITAVEPTGDGVRLTVSAPTAVSDGAHGASIAVSGVCLTAISYEGDTFTADVMKQTLDMSSLSDVAPGRAVNIERAMLPDTRMGGHIVQGHVDGTSSVREIRPGDQWQVIRFDLPPTLASLVVDKGSITVDGVSLTVSDVSDATATDGWFEVSLIPETLRATTLGQRRVGDRVNLETDIVARHVRRMLAVDAAITTREEGAR